MWKWMGLFLRKNHLLRCWGWLSPLNWIGDLTLSLLLKLPPRKLEPWFVLWSFFLLCISINLPYGHAWNAVVMSELVLPVSTFNCWISYKNGYAGVLVLLLLPLWNPWNSGTRRNVASLSLLYRYYFGRCSSKLAQLVRLPYSRGKSVRYSDRLHDFSLTIPICYKDVHINSFFPHTARLWILCL